MGDEEVVDRKRRRPGTVDEEVHAAEEEGARGGLGVGAGTDGDRAGLEDGDRDGHYR